MGAVELDSLTVQLQEEASVSLELDSLTVQQLQQASVSLEPDVRVNVQQLSASAIHVKHGVSDVPCLLVKSKRQSLTSPTCSSVKHK